ncbi:hypothetical protein [Phenylobacterium sp.]|uniref:hypothetical protein n=1 Tax=Phenylobacterium sp. TaxID=1871053 RepID=UPI002F92FED0
MINREAAVDRRRNVEASFAACAPAGWDLVRVPAREAADVAGEAGGLKPAERACYLSHLDALAAAGGEDALIVEDDTRFSPRTFETAAGMLAAAADCDVLFTELMPTDIRLLADLARQWPKLARERNFLLPGLAKSGFIGASAYLVRGQANAKLREALAAAELADTPYDLALGRLAREGRIQARFAFPFLTAPSADADRSQIQSEQVDLRQATLHAFRRLMFVDRDLAASGQEMQRLGAAHGDAGASLMGAVFAALISEAFPDEY